jgi:predicted nucleotide-binding protein
MLREVGEQSDFAVIILAKDDVEVREAADSLKARDNRVFEAGLLMGVVGEDRCFVVSNFAEDYLLSPLARLDRIPFEETAILTDPNACEKAIASVAIFQRCVEKGGLR